MPTADSSVSDHTAVSVKWRISACVIANICVIPSCVANDFMNCVKRVTQITCLVVK